MWIGLLLGSFAEASTCEFAISRPPEELAVHSELSIGGREVGLARGSLLRVWRGTECGDRAEVEVLGVPYFYRIPSLVPVEPGARGCIDPVELASPEEYRLLVLAPPPGEPGAGDRIGDLLDPPQPLVPCDAETIELSSGDVPIEDLAWVHAISVDRVARFEAINRLWIDRFGSSMHGRIWLSDWGYLSLPMARYFDRSDIETQWEREELRTVDQRERAIIAEGPDGRWLHFLGSDALYSDTWGRPDTVWALAELATDWATWCIERELASVEACIIQIGDLAWYNDRRPDPLGHSDHHAGGCVDMRLFRQDGSRYEAWWNREDDRPGFPHGYDWQLNRAFVDFARQHSELSVFLFNDPRISGVEARPGHDDHMHFCFVPNPRPLP